MAEDVPMATLVPMVSLLCRWFWDWFASGTKDVGIAVTGDVECVDVFEADDTVDGMTSGGIVAIIPKSVNIGSCPLEPVESVLYNGLPFVLISGPFNDIGQMESSGGGPGSLITGVRILSSEVS